MRLPEVRWAALAVVLFAGGGVAQLIGAPAGVYWTAYLACYAAGGWEPGLAGLRALRHRSLDVDLLMIVAAVIAAAIGQVLDGALLIIIFATSGALETVATARTRASVEELLDLTPQVANRLDADGSECPVAATDLAVGDLVRVRPGERIAADGTVVEGLSEVDQASVTGESLPVVKQPGTGVYAGTSNGTGALTVQVTRRAEESVLARIVAMVQEASETKAATQLFVETIEQRYSVAMVVCTLLLFLVPLGFGEAVTPTLLRAITFMIVASPCAVVLATMPPLLSAIANAGRHGVLVKSAVVMEQLGRSDTFAFDKTGTLTLGTPRLTAVRPLSGTRLDGDAILALAASAEAPSEHPLGAAITRGARHRSISLLPAREFRATPGEGVWAQVGGRSVAVLAPHAIRTATAGLRQLIDAAEHDGSTAVVVLLDGVPQAVLVLSDELRADAVGSLGALSALGTHAHVLLTGDNRRAAETVGARIGITDVRAELLPEDKALAVRELQRAGRHVLLVGDGVNDAPAMASAAVSVAMGRHGSDLALDTADAVVVNDELRSVPAAVALSRRARRLVRANLFIAAAVISVLVVWDLAGHLPLPLGVAGHEGSTVVVGLNGLRLLQKRAWQPPHPVGPARPRGKAVASPTEAAGGSDRGPDLDLEADLRGHSARAAQRAARG